MDEQVGGALEELKGMRVIARMVSAPIDVCSCEPGLGDKMRAGTPGEVALQ